MSNNYQDFNSPNTAGLPGYESGMWLSPQQEAYTPVVSVWPQVTTQYQHLLVLGAQGISPPSTTPTAGPVVGGSKKRGAEEAGFQQTQPQTKLQRKRSTLDSLPRNFQPSGPLPGSTPPNAPLLALQQLPLPTLIYTAPTGAQYYMDIQTPLLTPSSTLLAPPQPGLEFNPGILPGQATVNPAAARAQFPVSYARPASPESGSNDQQDVVACQEHAGQISAQAYAQASLTAGPQQLYATTAHVFFGHTTMAVPQGELQAAALPPMERGGRKKKDGAPGETFTLITTTPPAEPSKPAAGKKKAAQKKAGPPAGVGGASQSVTLPPAVATDSSGQPAMSEAAHSIPIAVTKTYSAYNYNEPGPAASDLPSEIAFSSGRATCRSCQGSPYLADPPMPTATPLLSEKAAGKRRAVEELPVDYDDEDPYVGYPPQEAGPPPVTETLGHVHEALLAEEYWE